MKIVVSHRALLARINRAHPQQQVRRSRKHKHADLGEYYVIDFTRNAVTSHDIDLAEYGRKLGLLADYEILEKEDK